MQQLITPLLLLLLFSCAGKSQKQKLISFENWKGHSVKELDDHPYFKHLPLKKVKHSDDFQIWIYRDQSRFQSDTYCMSLGGCVGIPIYNCDHAFSVKDGVIIGFEQNGTCPGYKVTEVLKK